MVATAIGERSAAGRWRRQTVERGLTFDEWSNRRRLDALARSRSAGKRITSRIESLPPSTIASRSMPIPRPPVGGMPYESAST